MTDTATHDKTTGCGWKALVPACQDSGPGQCQNTPGASAHSRHVTGAPPGDRGPGPSDPPCAWVQGLEHPAQTQVPATPGFSFSTENWKGRGGGRWTPPKASASRPPPLKPAGEDNGVSRPKDSGGFGERQAGHRVPRPLPLSPAVRARGCQLQGQLCAQGTWGGHPSRDTGRAALPHPGPCPQGSRRWCLPLPPETPDCGFF